VCTVLYGVPPQTIHLHMMLAAKPIMRYVLSSLGHHVGSFLSET
jgi:hypothetical protein